METHRIVPSHNVDAITPSVTITFTSKSDSIRRGSGTFSCSEFESIKVVEIINGREYETTSINPFSRFTF